MMLITHKPCESHKLELEAVGINDRIQHVKSLEVISVYCDGEELLKAYDILGRKPSSKSEMVFIGINAQEIVANW